MGKTSSVTKHINLETPSPRSCLRKGFSTLKSSVIEQPPRINVDKGGLTTGSLATATGGYFEDNHFRVNRFNTSGRLRTWRGNLLRNGFRCFCHCHMGECLKSREINMKFWRNGFWRWRTENEDLKKFRVEIWRLLWRLKNKVEDLKIQRMFW